MRDTPSAFTATRAGFRHERRSQDPWPELPTAAWRETCATLQLWTQIVGKIRLADPPWLNHSWHVTLYVTARGLTTSPIPDGARTFQIDFDFIDHRLRICDQRRRQAALCAGRPLGRELLCGDAGRTRRTRHRRCHRRDAERTAGADPVFARQPPRLLRSRRGAALLANPRQYRPRVQAIPHRLPRQGEPGAFLLGQFRSRGDALLGPSRAAPSRRRAASARCGRPRGLFARGQQRRLLAGQRRDRLSRVLFLCLSRAAGLPRGARCGRTRRSSAKRSANSSCPTTPCARPPIPTRRCSISCKAPTRPRPIAAKWDRDALECAPGKPGVVRQI